jgi:hypothetical protein
MRGEENDAAILVDQLQHGLAAFEGGGAVARGQVHVP